MSVRHLLLALVVVFIWGTNFAVIKIALNDLPPLLFAALRFLLAAVPAMFFFKRPKVAWLNLAAYGLLIGVGQFGLLYLAMQGHISPGLASLVVQLQVFFTIGLAMVLSGERPRKFQYVATVVAASGIAVIAAHIDGTTTLKGLVLVTLAAISWACGNSVSRATVRHGPVNMLAYVVWSSIFAVPPLLLLSLWLEGWPRITHSLAAANAGTWLAVAWQSFGNSIFGYGIWGWLLGRYSAASVTPMALLVPIFGMGASALVLYEPLPGWKILAAVLVMTGLAINVLWPRLAGWMREREKT
ncbi:MAG: EamA family transporter [Brachymonas sp.]|nr:EamA family transporter [Brachymonas sp.]